MDDCPSAPRVTELEMRLSHQDKLLDALNQVVIELRAELEDSLRRIARLESQLQQGFPDDPGDAPPPHY